MKHADKGKPLLRLISKRNSRMQGNLSLTHSCITLHLDVSLIVRNQEINDLTNSLNQLSERLKVPMKKMMKLF